NTHRIDPSLFEALNCRVTLSALSCREGSARAVGLESPTCTEHTHAGRVRYGHYRAKRSLAGLRRRLAARGGLPLAPYPGSPALVVIRAQGDSLSGGAAGTRGASRVC